MEKKTRLIGMPLMSIKEGCECGTVSQLIVDADAKRVTHFVLGAGKGLLGINKALPFEKLAGVGRDYITTSETANLIQVYTIGAPLANYLCDSDVIGILVVSSAGDIVGTIDDFAIDTKTGDILECYLQDSTVIGRANMITLAPKTLFVSDGVADQYAFQAKQAAPAASATPAQVSTPVASAAPAAKDEDPKKDAGKKTDGDGDDYFVKKQSEYLIGRKAKKDITASDGKVLIASGAKVTTDIIDKIRAANKLTELMLHVE